MHLLVGARSKLAALHRRWMPIQEAVRAVHMVVAPYIAYHARCSYLSDTVLSKINAACRQAVRVAARLSADTLDNLMHDTQVGMGLIDMQAAARAHHVRGLQSLAATAGPGGLVLCELMQDIPMVPKDQPTSRWESTAASLSALQWSVTSADAGWVEGSQLVMTLTQYGAQCRPRRASRVDEAGAPHRQH
jgi:hypothetical protein